MSNSIL